MILGFDAPLFFSAVADAEVHPILGSLSHCDPHRHLGRLLLQILGLDVHELEQRHAVQTALRFLHEPSLVDLPGRERERAPDGVLADSLVALNFGGAETRERSRDRHERQLRIRATSGAGALVNLVDANSGVRKAVIAKLVERHFTSRQHHLSISWFADLDREVAFQAVQVTFRNDVETREHQRRDDDRIAFRDGDGGVDGILRRIELDVERRDASVRKSAIRVKRLDPLQVVIELRPIKVARRAPWQLRTGPRRQRVPERRFVHAVHADELDRAHANGPGRRFFLTRDAEDRDRCNRGPATHPSRTSEAHQTAPVFKACATLRRPAGTQLFRWNRDLMVGGSLAVITARGHLTRGTDSDRRRSRFDCARRGGSDRSDAGGAGLVRQRPRAICGRTCRSAGRRSGTPGTARPHLS